MNSLKRDNQAGSLDPEFNKNGIRHMTFPEISGYEPEAILALPDDKLLVAIKLLGYRTGYAVVQLNKSGAIDTESGFGRGAGFVEVSFPDIEISPVFGLSLLNDGGSLLVGQYSGAESSGLLIVRLQRDGQLNMDFGKEGALFIDSMDIGKPEQLKRLKMGAAPCKVQESPGKDAKAAGGKGMSCVEQPDGKIVLVGTGFEEDTFEVKGVVMRLNPDGSFDKTFNGSGAAFVELGDTVNYSSAAAVALQSEKLVVCGSVRSEDGSFGSYVVRFDQDGRLDRSFEPVLLIKGEAGKSEPRLESIITRKQDGMIVAVGVASTGKPHSGWGVIVVLNAEGSFNLVFNDGQPLYSQLLYETGEAWYRCAFGGDGDSKIIVTGTSGGGFVTEHSVSITARYLLNGEADPTFNDQGWVVFDDDQWRPTNRDMAIMEDGKIVVSGVFWEETPPPFPYTIVGGWVLRYLA